MLPCRKLFLKINQNTEKWLQYWEYKQIINNLWFQKAVYNIIKRKNFLLIRVKQIQINSETRLPWWLELSGLHGKAVKSALQFYIFYVYMTCFYIEYDIHKIAFHFYADSRVMLPYHYSNFLLQEESIT